MTPAWPVRTLEPDASVEVNARRILAVRVAEFYAHEPIVNRPELAEALHDLRISAKRLRYTLELFQPWFGETGMRLISRIKDVQEALGDVHDHDVRVETIGEELSRLMVEQGAELRTAIAEASEEQLAALTAASMRPPPDDPRRGLIALLGREHQARRAAYLRFREIWQRNAAEGTREALVMLSAMPIDTRLDPGSGE